MSSRSLIVPQSSGLLAAIKGGDQTNTEVAAVQKAAFVERARRSVERDLAFLEMSDLEALGRHGIVVAGNVAAEAVAEITANPCATDGVGRVLKTTNIGLDSALRRYLGE